MKHGLRALRDTLPNEVDLTNKNVSIAVVGKDHPFTVYDDAGVDPFLAGESLLCSSPVLFKAKICCHGSLHLYLHYEIEMKVVLPFN